MSQVTGYKSKSVQSYHEWYRWRFWWRCSAQDHLLCHQAPCSRCLLHLPHLLLLLLTLSSYGFYVIIGLLVVFWRINISEIDAKLLQTRFNFNWVTVQFSLNIKLHYKPRDKFNIEEQYILITFYKMLNVEYLSTTNNV